MGVLVQYALKYLHGSKRCPTFALQFNKKTSTNIKKQTL